MCLRKKRVRMFTKKLYIETINIMLLKSSRNAIYKRFPSLYYELTMYFLILNAFYFTISVVRILNVNLKNELHH